LDGYKFDFNQKKSDVVVGYAAKFTLINGFEAIYYMSIDQLKQHGIKYSKTFQKGYGMWKDNFEAMANKTVLKLLLSKFAPLSVEMQKAVLADQSVVNDFETIDVSYVDNSSEIVVATPQEKEHERLHLMILHSETVQELENIKQHVPESMLSEYNLRLKQLKKKK
jgi:recombination protein RecT